jgi:preprotein translocase subunit Sss1
MEMTMTDESPSTTVLSMRQEDLDELLTQAAHRGAERCLAHLGLENGHAARDIRELRDLLEAWRDARRTAWRTAIKVTTTGILAVLLVGTAIKLKLMGSAQ